MDLHFTMIAQAVAFAILIWFTVKFVWPPLLDAIESRRQTIAEGLAEAEKGKASLVTAQKDADRFVAEAKSKAAEIIAQAEKQRSEAIEKAKGEALAEAEKVRTTKQAELEQAVFKAREGLRNQVADLAVAGASKILRREVNPQTHADLIRQLQAEL